MGYALRAQFQAFGWEVRLSRTVASALENLDPPPDWILLDLWLSDGDGEDVLRHVREAGIPSHVAVISAGLDPERIASLEPLKPDLMLPKPISFEKLLEACQSAHSSVGQAEPKAASSSPLRRSV
ncbi:Response regulator receiver domain-containing protein [Singulisphaera sp. GP187]|nr:Response regulator receiver domain-containing protein [Singulisphaera sp. GP187]